MLRAAAVPSPPLLYRLGLAALAGGLGFALLLLFYVLWAAPTLLPVVPVLVLAPVIGWALFSRPLLNLMTVLLGVMLLASMEEGFQIQEVLYGLYYMAYLAYWHGLRLFLYREPLLRTPADKTMAFFCVWFTLSLGMTFLYGGKITAAISEWTALVMFAFYFPVKDACVRYRWGPYLILGVMLALGFYIVADKIINYQRTILEATEAWQVVRGRSASYEMYTLVPSLATLTLLLFARTTWQKAVLLVGFLLAFGALLMTQSRGYWADFIVGAFVLFVLSGPAQRRRLVTYSLLGSALAAGIALVFFQDVVVLIAGGLLDRFLSIGTSATQDISLINRFMESSAVWNRILESPVLGHGLGVTYGFFDITYQFTSVKSFVHNGFLSLWYRFGVLGLLAVLYLWGSSVVVAYQAYRSQTLPTGFRVTGLIMVVTLVSLVLSCNTSNPFFMPLNIFMFTLLMATAHGLDARRALEDTDRVPS